MPGAAEKPGRDGQADIVVEADAALEHRGESRPVDREPRPQGDEKRRDPGQRQRDHQHQARDRHPREVGHGEAVDEERRQQDEIGEPLGPGPERVGQETRPPEPPAERDQPGGRRERQEDRPDHGWGGMTFLNCHPAPSPCVSMIPSENRFPLFRIMRPRDSSLHAPAQDGAPLDEPEDHRFDQQADQDHREQAGEHLRGLELGCAPRRCTSRGRRSATRPRTRARPRSASARRRPSRSSCRQGSPRRPPE